MNINQGSEPNERMVTVSGMYQDWFLDYASYVILERAVPAIEDGFKPVQRRILTLLLKSLMMADITKWQMLLVTRCNIIRMVMQVFQTQWSKLDKRIYLIDTQGNWGNLLTGDSAAASRYIEARLTKFALDVVYSPKDYRMAKFL